jgi:hypothetical protein
MNDPASPMRSRGKGACHLAGLDVVRGNIMMCISHDILAQQYLFVVSRPAISVLVSCSKEIGKTLGWQGFCGVFWWDRCVYQVVFRDLSVGWLPFLISRGLVGVALLAFGQTCSYEHLSLTRPVVVGFA